MKTEPLLDYETIPANQTRPAGLAFRVTPREVGAQPGSRSPSARASITGAVPGPI